MDNVVTVLVTGAGAPGVAGTIWSLRNNPESTPFRIITTDICDDVVGKFLADGFYRVPPPEEPEYIDKMLEICEKEHVKVIIPQTTREISLLSARKKDFESHDICVCVSDSEAVRLANDKYLLLKMAQKVNIPVPEYYFTRNENELEKALNKLGYPRKKVVVKPRVSNGMRGLRILTEEKWTVKDFLSKKPEGVEISWNDLRKILRNGKWPELIVTEFLGGNEYTVDVFRNSSGVVVIPRLREKIRSGITFDAKVELREDLITYSEKLANAVDLKYAFGFQFKLSDEGIPKLLECNPRVQGTMVTSAFAGFNMIYYSVKECLGNTVDLNNVNLRNGVKFKRYWGGIGIQDDEYIGRV